MLKNWRGVMGVVLIIASIAGIFIWESVGREALTYQKVVVLKEPMERNAMVTAEALAWQKVEKAKVIQHCITNPDDIIGHAAAQYIPAGTQLVAAYFEDPALVLDDGEFIFAIPNEWICAYPQTLRRRDTVFIYAVEENQEGGPEAALSLEKAAEPLLSAVVAYSKDNSNQEVESLDPARLSGTSNVSLVEIVATLDEVNLIREAAEQKKKFILLYR